MPLAEHLIRRIQVTAGFAGGHGRNAMVWLKRSITIAPLLLGCGTSEGTEQAASGANSPTGSAPIATPSATSPQSNPTSPAVQPSPGASEGPLVPTSPNPSATDEPSAPTPSGSASTTPSPSAAPGPSGPSTMPTAPGPTVPGPTEPAPSSGKTFRVIAYGPFRQGQAPGGEQPSYDELRSDLEFIEQFADGVRVYGTGPAESMIPSICDELGLDLHLGAWIDGLPQDEDWVRDLVSIVNEGHPSIKTAVIGNEVLLRARNAAMNGVTEDRLIELIDIARSEITVDGIQITTADTHEDWIGASQQLVDAVDIIFWHVHPWWAGQNIEDAASWAIDHFDRMSAQWPGKAHLLAETGWPTQFDNGSAVGSAENQARYFSELLEQLAGSTHQGWFFSVFDEPWKAGDGEGAVGAHWGIYQTDRSPKLVQQTLGLPTL